MQSAKNFFCPDSSPNRGFTLLQVLMTMGIISLLAAVLLGVVGKSQASARRAQCDVRLKTISMALDAHRQETGRYPAKLGDLRLKNYVQEPDVLRCPSDPRPTPAGSYEEYYAIRGPRDNGVPIVTCPFHEEFNRGAQAYTGRFTTQFAVQPATLAGATNATVEHPGKQAMAATVGLKLRGGDRILTGTGGAATIQFADGSTATLEGDSNVTVLQSFIDGHSAAPLYTLVRQKLGKVVYHVRTGSKFDVVTPTATAGARGTTFEITVDSNDNVTLKVLEGEVAVSTLQKTTLAPVGPLISILP